MSSMNFFHKIIYFLQGEMESPTAYSWFHLLWILFIVIAVIFLYKKRKNYNEKQLKTVLGVYSVIALVMEILKQIIWTFNYDPITNIITWDYQWYSFPFQLCTTPIYVCIICLFLKKNKFRNYLLSYISYITILGSFMTMIIPDSCFTSDILINIHTMWLHLGSFVVSIYLLMSGAVKIDKQSFKSAFYVFLVFVIIAEILNICIYNSGILNGETFNMFYISPYFISSLPVFDIIQQNVPFVIFLLIYIIAINMGALIVHFIASLIRKTINKKVENKSNK